MMVGLPFIFVLGPALFAILQTSITKGFYSGLQFAIGIALSDVMILSVCYLGASFFTDNPPFQIGLGMVGSGFMVCYGLYLFLKKGHPKRKRKRKEHELKVAINWKGVFSEVGKGFFMNTVNPFLWILWLSVISVSTAGGTAAQAVCFILGVEMVILPSDMLKAYFADRLTNALSEKVVHRINHVAGVLMMGCSVVLLIRTLVVFNLITLPFFN
ncbi:MAG: LysE family transporter [Bacteroidales bacterium]|nr:LysE family transporter [Bacteroidales bacterium]